MSISDVGAGYVAAGFARYAAEALAAFEGGRNGRVRGGHAVHAVLAEDWIGDVQLPVPACHVGIGSWNLNVLVATDEPVTCARCLRGADVPAGRGQLALF